MTLAIRSAALAVVTFVSACAQSPTGPTATTVVPTATDPPMLTCADVGGRLERRNNDGDVAWGVLTKPDGKTFAHQVVTLVSTRDGIPYDWDTAWSSVPWYLDSDKTRAYIDTPVTGQWTVTLSCGDRVLERWAS